MVGELEGVHEAVTVLKVTQHWVMNLPKYFILYISIYYLLLVYLPSRQLISFWFKNLLVVANPVKAGVAAGLASS